MVSFTLGYFGPVFCSTLLQQHCNCQDQIHLYSRSLSLSNGTASDASITVMTLARWSDLA
jgi:hypothetical protein